MRLLVCHKQKYHVIVFPGVSSPTIYLSFSIETMTDMAHHRNLQELDLSHNALEVLQGLSELKYLRILKLDHNKIRRITGLDGAKVGFGAQASTFAGRPNKTG